jgi:hypothetical protein
MSIKSQLVRLLAHLPKTQTVPERRALLLITGFDHLGAKIDSFEKSNLVFFSELVELIFSEGQAQSLEFLSEVVDSEFIGLEARQEVNDLIARIAALDPQQWNSEFIQRNSTQVPVRLSNLNPAQVTETVHLNLLELFFPKELYISDLAIERENVINNSQNYDSKLKKNATTRDVVRAALKQAGVAFGVDWICHGGKIITFHDLRDDSLPLSTIIDDETTTLLDSQEFYKIDGSSENIFKSLLGRCLQQKLYHQQVYWQHKEKLFIFGEVEGSAIRKEEWYGKKKDERTVYERIMKNNKPNEILRCKHFAFRTKYRRLGQNWYLTIVPDWFFSFDGYKRSFYAKDNLDWLKRHENDKSVYNHLRFITAFLKTEKSSDLFVKRHHYPFLSFGELITFNNAPPLNDDEWNPKTPKNGSANVDDLEQMILPLEL